MKDVLCFLNELDLADKLDNDCLEKLVEFKKMMVSKFERYNISEMIQAINNIDEIKLSDWTNDLDYRLKRTDCLRSVIFIYSVFKNLAHTNNKQEDKQ